MNNVQKLIPAAIEAVKEYVLREGEVPKEFNGYISSFGASLNTSGLLPTMVFYSQEGKSKGDRTSVLSSIEYIIKEHHSSLITNNKGLLNTIIDMSTNNNSQIRMISKIEDAAIAIKLAIRIFPKSKNETNVD